MYDNDNMGNENASKEWNSIIPMFLTSFNVYLCVVMHILCVYALKLLPGFFETRSGFSW